MNSVIQSFFAFKNESKILHTGKTWPSCLCVVQEYRYSTIILDQYHGSCKIAVRFILCIVSKLCIAFSLTICFSKSPSSSPCPSYSPSSLCSRLSEALHFALHTTQSTLHTAHCTMHTAHCTLHYENCENCIQHTEHYKLHTAHYTQLTAHSTLQT